MTTKEDVCRVASKWWRDVIDNPKFDNGDDSVTGIFTMGMAYSLAQSNKATEVKLNKFEDELYKILLNEDNHVYLMVDYEPCKILKDAAELSGISSFLFPYKTLMDVDLSRKMIFVRYGYNGKVEELNIV